MTLPASCAVLALLLLPSVAHAQEPPKDPKRWRIAKVSPIPQEYTQGIATLPGAFVFSGNVQLFKTGPDFRETQRNDSAIGPEASGKGYNHIGDLDVDPLEGGRLVLPLECYDITKSPPNTCQTGAFGIADPATLQWRYHVELDPRFIKKAMWVARSPDGLLWTQHKKDLLAYRSDAVVQGAPLLAPVRRLRNVAPEPLTGAAFYAGRLYGVVDDNPRVEMYSFELRRGKRRLEFVRRVDGESEGLTVANAGGGTLQWTILPTTISIRPPTFGSGRGVTLSMKRR